MACLCIRYMPRFSMPGMWYIWIMNVWRVKAFFYLQFKGPKSFGALNYSYIQMNLTLRTFFSFLLLFHEFRVYPSEGSSKIAKTISGKGFSRAVISKRFGPLLGRLAQTCVLVHGCFCLFPHSWGMFLRQCQYHISISLIVILDKYLPVRLLSCVSVWVCRCYASVCSLCSMPSDLWSSFWLAWRCHETKSWIVVSAYFLAGVWSLKSTLNITSRICGKNI